MTDDHYVISQDTGLSQLKLFEICREMITHEDALVNNRITWFLIFQGLLFNALFEAFKFYYVIPRSLPVHISRWGIYIFLVMGLVSSLVIIFSSDAALKRIREIKEYWNTHGDPSYPELSGRGFIGNRYMNANLFNLFILFTWCVLLVLWLIS